MTNATKKLYIEELMDVLETLTALDLIIAHNECCIDLHDNESIVYLMFQFDDFCNLYNLSPIQVVMATSKTCYSSFDCRDGYFQYTCYGFDSCDDVFHYIHINELAEAMLDNNIAYGCGKLDEINTIIKCYNEECASNEEE